MASTSTSFRPSTSSSSSFDKVNIPCKFYPACRFGNNCKFLHDANSAISATTSTILSLSSTSTSNRYNINNNFKSNDNISISSNSLNPSATPFVPNIYKQDFDPNFPPKSYADAVNANRENINDESSSSVEEYLVEDSTTMICPFLMKSGVCRYETCSYAHGELCELCGKFCLDPFNIEQRKKHERECIAAHEKEMELAFSIQRSKEKTCGICFDIVWEKDGREQRFGILPNCNHCFCLECIRTWRQAKQFDNKIIRACPECRTCSDFVCPSSFWVDSSEEKEKLITKYKSALSEKDCKYFKKGAGQCPFGNKCFYRHCLADGKKVDVGEPIRPKRVLNNLGNLENLPPSIFFWNYLEERMLADDLFPSDTESDDSDFLGFF